MYEIGDPRAYHLPDVTCDFSQVEVKELGDVVERKVVVSGARGQPPSDMYKVTIIPCTNYSV